MTQEWTPQLAHRMQEWVTITQAARRLGMSASWFKAWAKESGVVVARRGNRPGVDWQTVETAIATCRMNPALLKSEEGLPA